MKESPGIQLEFNDEYKDKNFEGATLVQGLPGFGFVGKIAADYLIDELQLDQVADIKSDYFPPAWGLPYKDGKYLPNPIKNELWYSKEEKMVVLTGLVQPDPPFCQDYADEILDLCEDLGIKRIIALGGMKGESSQTFWIANQEAVEELDEYGGKKAMGGEIFGMTGILPAKAEERNIKGLTLLTETPGYPDLKAAKSALHELSNYLQLKLDLTKLEDKADEQLSKLDMIRKLEKPLQKEPGDPEAYIR